MDLIKVDLKDTHQFSPLLLHYLEDEGRLADFYGKRPEIDAFKDQLQQKEFSEKNRKVLCNVLKEQYSALDIKEPVRENIKLLARENTFTITTGHQLNIFTGPLYFIYKIITVINACRTLGEAYPDKNFIPIYWMASEDHDFEEISYFRHNGKKLQWSSSQRGAVGRFDPKGLKQLLDELPGIPELFKAAYLKHETLADAVRYYVDELFGSYGLLVLNADDPELKSLFTSVIEDDILHHTAKTLVDAQTAQLEQAGYRSQVYPRAINFFYLDEELRSRIVEEDGVFKVLDTDIVFTTEELGKLIKQHPERFSPNVILRPLYEEVVLPNLAYVGGPAEVAYWLQLKPVFDHYKVAFPILMPRNFALVIPRHVFDKWNRTGLSVGDLFLKRSSVINKAVNEQAFHDLHLNGQKEEMMQLFAKIKAQAEKIDPTLAPHVEAQKARTQKQLDSIEKKFLRAEKRHQSDRIRQIEAVLDYLFPNGSPQERMDNFLNFYMANSGFIDQLIQSFDPFDYRYYIVVMD